MMLLGGMVLLGMARLGEATSFTDVTSTAGVGGDGFGTAWADYDGDGDLDLYVSNWNNGANTLYQNDGDGTFSDVTSTAGVGNTSNGRGMVWADYDGDGDLDLYVVNYGTASMLYRNDGHGTFSDVTSTAGVYLSGTSRSASFADYDGDGDLDLYGGNEGTANTLYQNNGDGTFSEMASTAGVGNTDSSYGTAWGDFDGDGDLDLYVAISTGGDANTLYQNDGDGTFSDMTSTAGVGDTGDGVGTAWGDFDGDGDLDLYVANYGSANTLYQNDLGVTSVTLVVKPLTATGALSIFGAVTLATSDGNVVALRSLDGGSGFCSQNR